MTGKDLYIGFTFPKTDKKVEKGALYGKKLYGGNGEVRNQDGPQKTKGKQGTRNSRTHSHVFHK